MRPETTTESSGSGGGTRDSQPGSAAPAAALHETLARLATAIASTRERQRRGPLFRDRAQPILGAVTHRRQDGAIPKGEARAAVDAFAARLRADGVPPERMLVLVKAAVRDSAPGVLDQAQLHALTEDVVRWSIEAYYAT
jgi:hypothetical protein